MVFGMLQLYQKNLFHNLTYETYTTRKCRVHVNGQPTYCRCSNFFDSMNACISTYESCGFTDVSIETLKVLPGYL